MFSENVAKQWITYKVKNNIEFLYDIRCHIEVITKNMLKAQTIEQNRHYYGKWAPFNYMQSLQHVSMIPMRWSINVKRSNDHLTSRTIWNSVRVASCSKRVHTARLRPSEILSIVLMSYEFAGHSISAVPSFSSPESLRRRQLQ